MQNKKSEVENTKHVNIMTQRKHVNIMTQGKPMEQKFHNKIFGGIYPINPKANNGSEVLQYRIILFLIKLTNVTKLCHTLSQLANFVGHGPSIHDSKYQLEDFISNNFGFWMQHQLQQYQIFSFLQKISSVKALIEFWVQ